MENTGNYQLTIIIPVYNEAGNIAALEQRLADFMPKSIRRTCVLFVDDGSTDGSLGLIADACGRHEGFFYIALERNSGLSAALKAGIDTARSPLVGYMDADLQTTPEDFNLLLGHINEYEMVTGIRAERRDSAFKKLQSKIANGFRRMMTHDGMKDTGCPLKVMRTACARRIPFFTGMHRFLPAFAFTNHGVPYADKPPLYLWLLMAAKTLSGSHQMWLLSLFSLVPALVTVSVMSRWVAEDCGKDCAETGGWMLVTCGLFAGMAVFLRMDMLMCMFITLSLRTFYNMVCGRGRRRVNAVMFPVYIFLAVFSKGPMGILVPFVTTVAFLVATGRGHTAGRYWGITTWAVLAVPCIAWFAAVYWEGGSGYLANLLLHQTVDRAVNSFHHDEPFYYYLIAIWYSMAPWTLLIACLTVYAVWRRAVLTDMQKLLLAAVCTTFVMLSLVSSKIQVYLLPLFPPAVYLAATLLPRVGHTPLARLSVAFPAAVFAIALPGWAVAAALDVPYMADVRIALAAASLSVGGCAALFRLRKQRKTEGAVKPVACGMLAAVFFTGLAVPGVNSLIGYKELCTAAQMEAERHGTQRFYTWNVKRSENMDVYLKQDVIKLNDEDITRDSLPRGVLMMRGKDADRLPPVLKRQERTAVGKYIVTTIGQ